MISHIELSNINQKKLQDQTGPNLPQRDEGQESNGYQIPWLGCGVVGAAGENLAEQGAQGSKSDSGQKGCHRTQS